MDKFGSKPEIYDGSDIKKLSLHTTFLLDSKSVQEYLKIHKTSQTNIIKKCKKVVSNACDLVHRQCRKDFSFLDWNANVIVCDLNSNDIEENLFSKIISKSRMRRIQSDELIRNIIIQFPIQIAVGSNDKFLVMYNGTNDQSIYNDCRTVYEMQKEIRFSAYDAVISDWDGNIVVISSMGRQSTGKSYNLNHLFGSKFDVSGMRCTDGCWMTLRIVNDILYIILGLFCFVFLHSFVFVLF